MLNPERKVGCREWYLKSRPEEKVPDREKETETAEGG
jgi:hypothetical protein